MSKKISLNACSSQLFLSSDPLSRTYDAQQGDIEHCVYHLGSEVDIFATSAVICIELYNTDRLILAGKFSTRDGFRDRASTFDLKKPGRMCRKSSRDRIRCFVAVGAENGVCAIASSR